MKIAVFILNALVQFAAAAFAFFVMLLALNGYHEKEATPGLLLYIILSILSVIGVGAGGAYAAHWLAAKPSFSKFGAAALAVPVFVIIGAIIISVVFFAAILVVRLFANK